LPALFPYTTLFRSSAAVRGERALGDAHLEPREPVAGLEQPLLPRVGEKVNRPLAQHLPTRPGRLAESGELRPAHRGVRGRNRREVVVSREPPGDIVVSLPALLRIALGAQEIQRVVAVRLVEP